MKLRFNFNSLKKLDNEKNKIDVENVEEINNDSSLKTKRRKKEILESGEVVEPHENKKWKRNGSKIKLSEFLENIFLNKKRIKYNYYLLLTFMFGLSFLSVYKTGKTYAKNNTESYESLTAFNMQNGDEIDLNKSVSSIFEERNLSKEVSENNDNISVNNDDSKKENSNIIGDLQKLQIKEETLNFVKPLKDYQVQKIYSIDSLIYSKTLDMWKIHNGIDLKAELNSDVLAVEKGTVTKIYDDSFLGKTVVILHINGYVSSYSNLSEEVNVKENEIVKKGQKIGTIGSSAIGEIKDEPHLHFMLYKDDEIIDPSFIIYE